MSERFSLGKFSAEEAVNRSRILPAGLAAVAGSVAANLLLREALLAALPLPVDFPPFAAGAVAAFTAGGTILGVAVFALIARWSRRPITHFRRAAIAALVFSILPNLVLIFNPAAIPFPFPGASGLAFGALIAFHVVAALISVLALTGLTRRTA